MRATWNGFFRLGQLMIPMRLFAATKSATPPFTQLHKTDKSPISHVSVCKADGKPLKPQDIIRAIEHDGTYIEISDQDIARTEGAEKSIVVRQFTDVQAVDPLYFEKSYYLVPSEGGELAYTVLRQAFLRTHKAAVATFVLHAKEHIALVRCLDGLLLLHQLRYQDEIVDESTIPTPALPQPTPNQIKTASELMERYSMEFFASDYHSQQNDLINEVVDRKLRGIGARRRPKKPAHATADKELLPAMRRLLESPMRELDSP